MLPIPARLPPAPLCAEALARGLAPETGCRARLLQRPQPSPKPDPGGVAPTRLGRRRLLARPAARGVSAAPWRPLAGFGAPKVSGEPRQPVVTPRLASAREQQPSPSPPPLLPPCAPRLPHLEPQIARLQVGLASRSWSLPLASPRCPGPCQPRLGVGARRAASGRVAARS